MKESPGFFHFRSWLSVVSVLLLPSLSLPYPSSGFYFKCQEKTNQPLPLLPVLCRLSKSSLTIMVPQNWVLCSQNHLPQAWNKLEEASCRCRERKRSSPPSRASWLAKLRASGRWSRFGPVTQHTGTLTVFVSRPPSFSISGSQPWLHLWITQDHSFVISTFVKKYFVKKYFVKSTFVIQNRKTNQKTNKGNSVQVWCTESGPGPEGLSFFNSSQIIPLCSRVKILLVEESNPELTPFLPTIPQEIPLPVLTPRISGSQEMESHSLENAV